MAGADDLYDDKRKVDAELEDAEYEVLAYNKKVARATRDVLDAREQLPEAQKNLQLALGAQALAQNGRQQATAHLAQARSEVQSTERRRGEIEDDIAELRSHVGDFARRAYQMGPLGRVQMLLAAEQPSDFTYKLAAIDRVGRASNNALEEMNTNRADLVNLEIELTALRKSASEQKKLARAQLAAAKESAAGALAAKDLVDALIAQEKSAVKVAKDNRADVKAQYKQLAEDQEKLQKEIARAARRLAKRTGIKTDTSGGSGQWQWPLPGGTIGSEAGWRVHPILGYTRCHTGFDVSAASGTTITAADDGVVLSAGDGGAFGNYTVISHGGNLTSSYAHQSTMVVSAGDVVKRGQMIGLVGSTGWSTGPHLHFEARIAGAPWDPRGWFGMGEKVPVCL